MSRLQPHLWSWSSSSLTSGRGVAFDIDDFTCVSNHERSLDALEKHLRRLLEPLHDDLVDDVLVEALREAERRELWSKRRRIFALHNFDLSLTRCTRSPRKATRALDMMANFQQDFNNIYHDDRHDVEQVLELYFGLDDFFVVEAYNSDSQCIDTLTKVNTVLGASSVALANSQCEVPLFVQVMNKSRGQYEGVHMTPDVRVSFDSLVLPSSPVANLDDLVHVFRERINIPTDIEGFHNIKVTVRTNYVLREWGRLAFTQDVADFDQMEAFKSTPGFLSQVLSLPFGSVREPIDRLVLSCIWRHLDESTVMETATHTDLLPMTAPIWTCYVHMAKRPSTILRSYLDEVVSAISRRESIRQLIGSTVYETKKSKDEDKFTEKSETEKSSRGAVGALTRLTGPTYSLSDIINSGRSSSQEGPISSAVLDVFLEYLFPRSSGRSQFEYPRHLSSTSSAEEHELLVDEAHEEEGGEEDLFDFKLDLSAIKSCPENGLVWRLSILMAHCLSALGGVESAAYLFHKFVLNLRLLWETSTLIPGLPSGPLDHSYCLMHQKLQMINACINTKLARERGFTAEMESGEKSSSESDEDEFYECDDDDNDNDNDQKDKLEGNEEQDTKASGSESVPVWCQQPVGRLRRHRNLRLLKRPNVSMYVPHCQEMPNLPDDTLIEQEETMLELGDSAEGSSVRTQMHTLSLLSDMEAFKAANPGCVLEDFVRWYSPRDYIERDGQGHLSARMASSDKEDSSKKNVWLETWQHAKPVCARRQKRLFDDTREAERTLAFFASLTLGQTCELLLLPLLHAAFVRVVREPLRSTGRASVIRERLQKAVSCLVEASHLKSRAEVAHATTETRRFMDDFERRTALVEESLRQMEKCEVLVSRALSLRTKFVEESLCIREKTPPEDKESVEDLIETLLTSLLQSAEDDDDDDDDHDEHSGLSKGTATTRRPVVVVGGSRGPAGRLLRKLFHDSLVDSDTGSKLDEDDVFVAPIHSKEYILRSTVPRPFSDSKKCPQRMYARVQSDKFVLALATSVDRHAL